ncbi:uncharacterized protein BO88DRAFT_32327 [Aspergillus vadensis CBS 113365]|uniref:Uncharacterized protein n=2 Tax=Aspergillus subgen. Circumdati TaxID=2720871 RepID=A0A319C9L9_ASPVC|nr:hypothetical protein BO88DRAFT_32327 [Aspergillus vadensis CBS 113365]PYH75183.1 hypothetical protein BO88DRAFT_32327 [Aspergillus vadensis CBS 113365]RDH14301.1 hypothetical protein M747DRAFT_169122 [Aspergillus niger ATCC 13496]
MADNNEIWISCQAGSVAPVSLFAHSHVLSALPTFMNLPRTRLAGSTIQQPASNMSSSVVSFLFRDGSVDSVSVRDKGQVIDTRRKFMVDGWIVMQNQTFLDATIEQRQIEHNDAVKQFLRVDEGTYLPGRFRKREMNKSNSLFVPSSGLPDLKLINVFHLGGQSNSTWIFEYFTPNEHLRKSVLLSGTDIICVAGWMKDWRIPYIQGQAGILAEIVYLQQRPFD